MSLESSILSSLAQKLGELLADEAKLLWGVEGQVQTMQRELTWMRSYLKDVDEGQEESNETFLTRIREIRNIAFDAENVIDSFIFVRDTRRRKGFLKRYASFFNYLMQKRQVACEIEAINVRIQDSKKMFETYQINRRNEQIRRRRPQSSPHNIDEYVVGLEDDVGRLVKKLTTIEYQEKVLCIVGMGGSGKTTLVRKIYNHETIKQHFLCHAWVSISQEWSVGHILTQILRQATSQQKKSDETWSFQELVEEVRTHLEQKLYLIVLDDVWEKEALKSLLPAFPFGSKGSKIIVTTRFSKVVEVPGLSYSFHEPRRLNDIESWDLLTKIVLNQWQIINKYQLIGDFERLGKEMLKKCAGLPLAIIALGGILCTKHSIEEWETMSKNVTAKVMGGSGTQDYGTVKDVLALSYHELPYDLKPCFLYFALFPEDFEIPVKKLMKMWIFEGFITKEQRCGEETLKDVARQFLDELIQRCIIQVASRNYKGKVNEVRIHDLIRELCIKKAKELDFLQIFHPQSSTAQTPDEGGIITQSCRIGIHFSSSSNTCIPFQAQNTHLRSLFVFESERHERSHNWANVHKKFRFLKVLDIKISCDHRRALVLPTEIGNLIYLTYLGIEGPLSVTLPKSITNLRNLLTLDCKDCKLVIAIPNLFLQMYRLQHLLSLDIMVPDNKLKLHTLKSLQTLWSVTGGNWMLKEMSTLSPIVKRLGIHRITTNEQLEAVFQCPSFKSGHLHTLSLDWGNNVKLRNIKLSFLCHGLRKLLLTGPIGEEESSTSNMFPPNLEKVTLTCSMLKSNETMAMLGKLPNLRYLDLLHFSYIGRKWTCNAGEFPQLEDLRIYELPNLKEWRVEEGAMPRLRFLTVEHCPRLTRLPKLGNNVVVDRITSSWDPNQHRGAEIPGFVIAVRQISMMASMRNSILQEIYM